MRFERLVREALADLPPAFARRLDNVAVLVAEQPTPAQLAALGLGPGETLFGLYEGTPLGERGASYHLALPDRITIFHDDALAATCAIALRHNKRLAFARFNLPNAHHRELIEHPRVLRVVALSGGYTREEADARLTRNPGLIASFSRALTEGLTEQMSDDEFNAALDASIAGIYAASST